MKLSELVGQLNVLSYKGDLGIEIDEIVYDSRKAVEDSIFVAIQGFKADGHNFIKEAVKKGAKAVLIEKDIKIDEDITVIKVENTRFALAKMAAIYYKIPSEKLNIIGVTGTNAKTTTTYLVNAIFEGIGRKTGIIGTIGTVIDHEITKTSNTTPESLDLQKIFDEMVKSDVETCIMEVSSHSLELYRVEECHFNVAIFTNLTIDHLDFHHNIDNYFKAKTKLFFKTTDYNVINLDDPYGRKIIESAKQREVPILTYGIESTADIHATDIVYYATGVSFLLNTPKGTMRIAMKIPGLFSVYNGLAAASCGYAYGIALKDIKNGLESVEGVKGRFEVIPTETDFTVIIDFAHTPDGLEKVMETISQFAKGRKIILFGAGGDRDYSKRTLMGEVAAKYGDLCIVTSDNSRSEDSQKIIDDIVEGVKKQKGHYITYVDRLEAIRYAIEHSQPGDVILLAGKGHENYQIIGDKKFPFNEREIVLNLVKEYKKDK